MNRAFIHDALSDRVPGDKQVHLARAAEEASELTKECMKALRFGLDNRYPPDGPTNAEKIVAEFRDVEHALSDAGLTERLDDLRWHGCLTGDCPHGKQSECDASLAQALREATGADR